MDSHPGEDEDEDEAERLGMIEEESNHSSMRKPSEEEAKLLSNEDESALIGKTSPAVSFREPTSPQVT